MIFHSIRLSLMLAVLWSPQTWGAPHIDLGVVLDPAKHTLGATASITTDSDTLTFYLANGFVLESAEVDGATVPTDRTVIDGLQRFQIELYAETSLQVLKLRYHGELEPLDISMTHDETLVALPAMASAKGSYLPGNSGWHPMLESAFTYRVAVTVPAGQIPVAPGAVSDVRTIGDTHHAVFSLMHPIDGIDLMVGPWKINEREVQVGDASIRLRTYFDANASALANGYLDAAHAFIKRYSTEIGPYPYSEFSVVSSPIPTGFGMPTLTYLGQTVLHYPFIRDISLGHEVLHNWWGNGVRVDPVRGNWAEGLTTFMADYAYREEDSAESAAQMRHGWLRDYAALPAGSEQPLSTFRGRHRAASAAIGYGKAAMMFHALRARLGEDAFRDGVRKFWEEYKFKTASFDNLRQVFEETGEQPLVEFFDQWLDRTGAPTLDITSARTIEEEDAGLEVHISQDAEPYSLSIPLKVFGREEEQDFRIELSQPDQSFRLATREAATAVQIDPGFEVWRKLVPGEAPPILRDLIAADQILVATVDRKPDETVLAFAQEFSEGIAKEIDAGTELVSNAPVLVVSSKAGSADFLERLSLSPRSEELPAGQVEVWIVPDFSRKIVMVALDPEAVANQDLPKLGRRLRHFGRYAWVSFSKDGKAERGSWAVNTPRISIPK